MSLVGQSRRLETQLDLQNYEKTAPDMLVFDELRNICLELANTYSLKIDNRSRSVIEQCRREREENEAARWCSQPAAKSKSESNVFTSIGGNTPTYFGDVHAEHDKGYMRRKLYFRHYRALYESDEIVKKIIGSVDVPFGDFFEGLDAKYSR